MEKVFTLTKREDISPKCPHCEEELGEIFYQEKGFPIYEGKNVMYFCQSCLKVLGFAESVMGI